MDNSPSTRSMASPDSDPTPKPFKPATSRMIFQEDSPTPSPAKRPAFDDPFAVNKEPHPQTLADALSRSTNANFDMDSDEGSDFEVRKPVGRAARRMLGANISHGSLEQPAQSSTQDLDDDDLYSATPKNSRKRKSPSPPASDARSGLFVSPAKSNQADSDDELSTNPTANKKLADLVAEKRAERLAKEADEEARRQRRALESHGSDLPDEMIEDSEEDVDPNVERIMSDAAPPVRKASKKALAEMNAETQRLARQQGLAHEMKVKKTFTPADLFTRLNYHPNGQPPVPVPANGDSSGSSAPNSDGVESVRNRRQFSTPPSSPPTPYAETPFQKQKALVEKGALSKMMPAREDSLASIAEISDDDELPSMAQILSKSQAPATLARETPLPEPKKGLKLAKLGKKAVPVRRDDSDDELEIIKEMPRHLSVFDKAKGLQKQQNTDSKAIHTLKHLAHIGQDSAPSRQKKGNVRPTVDLGFMQAQLRMRAKQQARTEQEERIAGLKAKGVQVQTSEEREREQEIYENLLEKAKEEAVELRKAEKAARKEAGGEGNALASDDESEDEDYTEGSEDENDQADEAHKETNDLVDELADESEGEDDEGSDEEEAEDQDAPDAEMQDAAREEDKDEAPQTGKSQRFAAPSLSQTPMMARKARKSRIVLDDDEEESYPEGSEPLAMGEPAEGVYEDPFAAFNFGAAAKPGSSLMSPTQAFNATMQTPTQATQEDSMDVLKYLVPPSSSSLPPMSLGKDYQTQSESQASMVPGSQVPESQQVNLLWETQAPETPVPGINRGSSNLTLDTPGWEPTQDDGLPSAFQATPGLRRENAHESVDEHDTQSTVRVRISESPAPQVNRKRLVRGHRALVESSDDEEIVPVPSQKPAKKDAFQEMARKRKEAMTATERDAVDREMKQMMEEQAEESEDEYAGLGGDDFVAPETEQDREMIDSSEVDVNVRELAALHAERQRAADDAEAQKLYKDLTTGGLRRKQANAFDLDDDEDDLAMRRRQMKQREEARKRKLLLQDDNIAGLAEGKHSKGKDAFLKAIQDDDERDDDILDLSDIEEVDEPAATQTDSQQSQQVDAPAAPLREISPNKRRIEEAPQERRPAKQRRTAASAFRAPTSLGEVRESVSFLLDEPHAPKVGPSMVDLSSDSEKDDDENDEEANNADDDDDYDNDDAMQDELDRQNDGGFAPDRVAMPPPRLPASQRRTAPKTSVVDRLSLKRGNSASESAQGRTAWAASNNSGFKAPSLLRRATTNTAFNANERGVSTSNGVAKEASGVKMGGTKKSSLAYQARDAERKAKVDAFAKAREENTARIANLRRKASSGFGKGMGGNFE